MTLKSSHQDLTNGIFDPTKGQIKPKADWCAIDSPRKRTNEFVFCVFFCFSRQKTKNSIVWFLRESTARQSAFGF